MGWAQGDTEAQRGGCRVPGAHARGPSPPHVHARPPEPGWPPHGHSCPASSSGGAMWTAGPVTRPAPHGPRTPGGPHLLPPGATAKREDSPGRLPALGAPQSPCYSLAVGGRGPVVEGRHPGLEHGSGCAVPAGGHELRESKRERGQPGAGPLGSARGLADLCLGPAPWGTGWPEASGEQEARPLACEADRLRRPGVCRRGRH